MRKIPTFDQAMELVNSNESFMYKDEQLDDNVLIRTFHYSLASYSDFCLPYSWNMRGIVFDLNTKEIVALPFEKFFNYKENPFTMDDYIKDKKIIRIMEKYDGSLVYFYMINNILYCRTKLNAFSEQAKFAMEIVNKDENLRKCIEVEIELGFTPMFEFISPRNQIVVAYDKEQLKYLCSRNMYNGNYVFKNFFEKYMAKQYTFNGIDEINDSIKTDTFENKEGLVIVFDDFQMMKIKTEDYYNKHHLRDNVLNEKCLVAMILDGKSDDAKAVFANDVELTKYINEIENKVMNKYNTIMSEMRTFYEENKDLDRKSFAMKAKKELNNIIFHLVMGKYTNKFNEDNFKEKFVSDKLWTD